MRKRHCIIGWLLLFALLSAEAQQPVAPETSDTWQLAKQIFSNEYTFLYNYVTRDQLSAIYDIQAFTNSLLVRGVAEGDYPLLDSLSAIYLNALHTLREVRWYPANTWKKQDSLDLGRTYRMWLYPKTQATSDGTLVSREEYHLSSSQFLFLVAQAVHAGLSAPQGRYPNIDSLLAVYPEVILGHHYQRWILDTRSFRLSGWGCAKGSFNHREFLALKRTNKFRFKPTICPVLTDADLFIIAGLALMMDCWSTDSARVSIGAQQRQAYRQYLTEAEALLSQRIELRPIRLPDGPVEGFAFDNGYYRDYKDHRYALYTGEAFPDKGLKVRAPADAAWDVSHARRFFYVFNALNQAQPSLGLSIDYNRVLQGLARQYYHVVYTDTVRHLFANYLNGDNGWYRVGYHGEGFGYPPYSMSQAAIEGGWFFLGRYYPPVAELGPKLWVWLQENPGIYNQYYGVVYKNYQPVRRNFSAQPKGSERLMLLQWLPGI